MDVKMSIKEVLLIFLWPGIVFFILLFDIFVVWRCWFDPTLSFINLSCCLVASISFVMSIHTSYNCYKSELLYQSESSEYVFYKIWDDKGTFLTPPNMKTHGQVIQDLKNGNPPSRY